MGDGLPRGQQWLQQNYPSPRHYRDLVPAIRRGGGQWVYAKRTVLRIWEEGHIGPDPRIGALVATLLAWLRRDPDPTRKPAGTSR